MSPFNRLRQCKYFLIINALLGNLSTISAMDVVSLANNQQAELCESLKSGTCTKEQLETFIRYGVDLNSLDEQGRTLLHYAVYSKELMLILLDNGVKVNAQDYQGATPLHELMSMRVRGKRAWNGSLEEIVFLLDNEADVTIRDNNGRSPLFYTTICCPRYLRCKAESDSTLKRNKQLLKHIFQQLRTTDSMEVRAELYYWVGSMQYSGELGYKDVDSAEYHLVKVAGQSHNLAVQALASYVLGKIYLEKAGRMLHFRKALECFEKVAKQPHSLVAQAWANYQLGEIYMDGLGPNLFMVGCDLYWDGVNKDSDEGSSFLEKAYEQSYDLETQALAAYRLGKIYLNNKNYQKGCECFNRARRYFEEIIHAPGSERYPQIFIRLAAIYDRGLGIQQDLKKAFSYFEQANKHDQRTESNDFSESQKRKLCVAAVHGLTEICRFLIGKGADVNQVADGLDSPLRYAAEWDHCDVVSLLLEEGAHVDGALENDSEYPLTLAVKKGQYEIALLLLKKGACVDAFSCKHLLHGKLVICIFQHVSLSRQDEELTQPIHH